MKELTIQRLIDAHKVNNMFYVGTLSTGHIVFARVENTNFFEDNNQKSKDYTMKKGFSTEKLIQLKLKERNELGFIPERMCKPEARPQNKYKDFYGKEIIQELTDKASPAFIMVLDSEFHQEHRVYAETGELVFQSFEQEEAVEFLKNSEYKTVQNYEIMTSLACSFYMQHSICTFNIISPLDKINNKCHYEEMPKIDMAEWLNFAFTVCGIDYGVFSKKAIDEGKLSTKSKCLELVLLAHNGRAEWNKFKWPSTREFDAKGKLTDKIGQPVMNYLSNIQGGDITVNSFRIVLERTPKKFQNIEVSIRDTMSLIDADHKKLDSMGKLTDMGVQAQKVNMSHYGITHMDIEIIERPEHYIQYSVQDTIVPLVYVASLYGVNHKPDITLLTGAQRVAIGQVNRYSMNELDNYVNEVLQECKNKQWKDKNGKPLQILSNNFPTKEGYDIVYRGIRPNHKKSKDNTFTLYEKDNLIPVNDDMKKVLQMAQQAYSGGENFCAYISVPRNPKWLPNTEGSARPLTKRNPECETGFTGSLAEMSLYYDLDVQSAYPTAMYCICAVNVVRPIAYQTTEEIEFDATTKEGRQKFTDFKKTLVKEINKKNRGNCKPLKSFDLGIPGFVRVKSCITPKGRPLFRDKLYGENVPVNPRVFESSHGDSQANNVFTFLELQQSIEMGCDIVLSEIVITNPVFTDKSELVRPLGEATVEIIQLRKEMAKKYGKKSLPALICKLIANGCYYGKTAQGNLPTTVYSPIENENESIDRGPSRMTQPVYASYTTAGTRCLLSCAGFQMYTHGYGGWLSQTTDGGITTVPEFLVNAWCGTTTMGKFFKGVRTELTQRTENKVDDRLFVMKHVSQELYNFTTRGNVGFNYDKEIQIPIGYINTHDTSRGFKYETYYVSHLLSETEREEIGEDYIVDSVCAMQGFKSSYGYAKGSEEFKKEIVESYMRGDLRVQINTYKPESLSQKQRAQINKAKDEEREFPMSVMQKTALKMNFDGKNIPYPEDLDEVEINGMAYVVGWTRSPMTYEEAGAYRTVMKNTKRCLRNKADWEDKFKKKDGFKPLTKKQMGQLIRAHVLGLVTVNKFNELGEEDRLEFINEFVTNSKEGLTLTEMKNFFKKSKAEDARKSVEEEYYKSTFDKTLKSMNEVTEEEE